MSNDLEILHHSEEELDYAFVRKVSFSNGLNHTFIRLVRPGPDVHAVHSWSADISGGDVTIDQDESGNVIGVTITTFDHETEGA